MLIIGLDDQGLSQGPYHRKVNSPFEGLGLVRNQIYFQKSTFCKGYCIHKSGTKVQPEAISYAIGLHVQNPKKV